MLRRSLPLPSYIPLQEGGSSDAINAQQQNQQQQQQLGQNQWQQQQQGMDQSDEDSGKTMEEFALQRVRDLNAATRERPEDVGLWLKYAAFQDEASQLLGRG